MATAAEKKKAAEAAAAAEKDTAADAVAVESAETVETVEAPEVAEVEVVADESGPSDSVDPRPSLEDAEPIANPEEPVAKKAAVKGVGQAIAAAPLAAREEPENVYESHSDPNVPVGTNEVIASYAERNDGSYIAAEDGDPIDAESLFLGPDPSGQFISTVRLVQHSTVEPYGHPVTTLVVAAGVPVDARTANTIKATLAAQA